MDHHEVLEQLELAALEPDGFERLMAGDTPTAAAVAGHLAGCASCAGELERLRRAAPLLRDVVRTTPPADLRDRTLAYVRERGVPRGADREPVAVAPARVPDATIPAADAGLPTSVRDSGARRSVLPWVGAIAAAVVISVVASTAYMSARLDDALAARDRTIAGLEAVTVATLTITADPAAQRVALTSTGIVDAAGSLVFSPTTSELVVVASGLEEPPDGQEYRCWVEVDGARGSLGRMYFADELAYWVGVDPIVATVPDGATFGVSLVESDGSGAPGDPVMLGEL